MNDIPDIARSLGLSAQDIFNLTLLGFGIIVFCSIITMFSIWITASNTTKINDKLDLLLPPEEDSEENIDKNKTIS